jgi:hypothetical protein
LGERLLCKQEVTSSNLVVSTSSQRSELPIFGREALHLDNCIRKEEEKTEKIEDKQREASKKRSLAEESQGKKITKQV